MRVVMAVIAAGANLPVIGQVRDCAHATSSPDKSCRACMMVQADRARGVAREEAEASGRMRGLLASRADTLRRVLARHAGKWYDTCACAVLYYWQRQALRQVWCGAVHAEPSGACADSARCQMGYRVGGGGGNIWQGQGRACAAA